MTYSITWPQWVNLGLEINFLCGLEIIFIGIPEAAISFLNSLTPGSFKLNLKQVIIKLNLVIDGWGISCEIALR